jgi:hypothetical protein
MKTPIIWNHPPRHGIPRLALAVLALSALAGAASLTDADRKEGLAQLDRTRAGVVEATKGLSEAQWKFKSAPDRWSVAEVLEHIALAEDFLFENTTKNVMSAPTGPTDRDPQAGDQFVLKVIPDRTNKFTAPEPLVPTGRWPPHEALDRFLAGRARTAEFLKSTPDLREHVVDSPVGQKMDAYQWLLFMSAHSERHTKQILEVKADPNFPKM